MKVGERVRGIYSNKQGISKGPYFHFGVWWILVEWDDGNKAMVLESALEIINMWEYEGCNPNQFIDFKKDKDK